MHSVILFPPSRLFNVDFVIVPKRLFSSCVYTGYHTLVTYPTTFLKKRSPAGYLLLLLYKDGEDRRICHVSSIQCWKMNPEDAMEFVATFTDTTEIDRIIVETYSPPPEKTHCVFPYSEVLLALPSNVELSECLKKAHFKEILRIPCYEFLLSEVGTPEDLAPYGDTEEERQLYWKKWVERPEALSIRARCLNRSLFIENYLYDFPFFSRPDMVLFGKGGIVHWVPDIAPYLITPEVPYAPKDLAFIKRAKIFRTAGEDLDTLIQDSIQYISSKYGTEIFQLDNIAAPGVLEPLRRESIVADCNTLYERIVFSKDLQ
ncbi:MAG: hypothetical protein HXS42_03280 [Theionarchaea archaeon]|nr:hypothetical protein [Theionarchaea archaeon]